MPADEPKATIVSARGRAVTEHEIVNFGANECDACLGDVSLSAPA